MHYGVPIVRYCGYTVSRNNLHDMRKARQSSELRAQTDTQTDEQTAGWLVTRTMASKRSTPHKKRYFAVIGS